MAKPKPADVAPKSNDETIAPDLRPFPGLMNREERLELWSDELEHRRKMIEIDLEAKSREMAEQEAAATRLLSEAVEVLGPLVASRNRTRIDEDQSLWLEVFHAQLRKDHPIKFQAKFIADRAADIADAAVAAHSKRFYEETIDTTSDEDDDEGA